MGREDIPMVPGGATGCRALVPCDGAAIEIGVGERPLAAFVTQLIACKRRLPPFRKAGRTSPEDASGQYVSGRLRPTTISRLDVRT